MQEGSDTPDVLVWVIVLLVQSIPYLSGCGNSVGYQRFCSAAGQVD